MRYRCLGHSRHTSWCGLQMPPTQGLWSLFDHPFLTYISFFQMSRSLGSRMWFSATTLRKLWVLLPMIQTAATLKAVSLTITLSHETIPRGLLGIKMRVSSLSAEMSPVYHSSLVEDTVSKAIGFLQVHGRRSHGE